MKLLNEEPFPSLMLAWVFAICQPQGRYLIIDQDANKYIVHNLDPLRIIRPFRKTKRQSPVSPVLVPVESCHGERS